MNRKTIIKLTILICVDITIFFVVWLGISSLYNSVSFVAVGLMAGFVVAMLVHIFASMIWFKDYIKEFNLIQEAKNESQ